MSFSDDEIDAFERYTPLLVDLCNKEMGGFNHLACGMLQCVQCARKVPAGIPKQLQNTDWQICPACVKKRAVVPALRRRIYGEGADRKPSAAEVASMIDHAKKPVMSTQPAQDTRKIEKGIEIYERRMLSESGDEHARTSRILEMMRRALRTRRGS